MVCFRALTTLVLYVGPCLPILYIMVCTAEFPVHPLPTLLPGSHSPSVFVILFPDRLICVLIYLLVTRDVRWACLPSDSLSTIISGNIHQCCT